MFKLKTHYIQLVVILVVACLGIVSSQQSAYSQNHTPILIESDDAHVGQSGEWTRQEATQASAGSYVYSSGAAEDVLTLNFEGPSVEIVYVAHEALGVMAIEIDNVVMRTVVTTAETTGFNQRAVIDYLDEGPHVLKVYAASGVIGVDAFVTRLPMRPMQPTAGVTWYVNATTGNDGNGCLAPAEACLTITAAIGKATADDTLMIAAGTYHEVVVVNKNLTIHGADEATTILDGVGLIGRIVTVNAGVTATITHLTIANADAKTIASDSGGGLANFGTLSLQDVTISGNNTIRTSGLTRQDSGAGVYNGENAVLTLTDCVVTNNTAKDSGSGVGAVGGGMVNYRGTATLLRTTFSNNLVMSVYINAAGLANGGGIFFEQGQLTIIDSSLINNIAKGVDKDAGVAGGGGSASGGALYAEYRATNVGTISITNSVISGNRTIGGYSNLGFGMGEGGGIYTYAAITITDSILTDNISSTNAGALFTNVEARISNTIIANNVGQGLSTSPTLGFGGGIVAGGNFYMQNSAVVNNTAMTSDGGGMLISGGVVVIANTTISGNQAARHGGGIMIATDPGSAYLTNNTIVNNRADSNGDGTGDGGGLYGWRIAVNLKGNIIAQNTDLGNQAPDCAYDAAEPHVFTSFGYNLIGQNNGCTVEFPAGLPNANGDFVGTAASPLNPLIDPLANNGGVSQTHGLLAGSVALDAIPAANCTYLSDAGNPWFNNGDPVTTDQRLLARPMNGLCDIGAYEGPVAPLTAPSTLAATPTSQTQINLGWIDNTTLETGYRIERSADGRNWQEIGSVGANVTSYQNTNLTCETTYYYRVRAFRSSDSSYSGYSNGAQATTPACPLSAPSSLTATPISQTQINLGWVDNTTLETAYRIERSLDGTNWQEIGSVGANVTSYQNTSLTCETTYHYRVRAYRSNDNSYSGYSNGAQATPLVCPLNAPSDLTATAVGNAQINLGWTDQSNNETTFRLERSPDGTNWQEIGVFGANVISYQNTNLSCGMTYQYRVRAYRNDTSTYSQYSNVAQASTGTCTVTAPSTLTWTAASPTQINLGWTDQSNNETSFRVERSLNGTTWQEIATVGANVVSYQNTNLTCGITYYYRVRAFRSNDSSYSGYSNVAQATATCTVTAPSNLTATAVSATQINLSWTDRSNNETSFRIQRSRDGTDWQDNGNVGANVTSYQNTTPVCGTTYYYRVRAHKSDTNSYSSYSNVAQATTLACPLYAPSNLMGMVAGQTQIGLLWNDNTTLETAYRIERSPDGTNWQEIGSVNANVTSYQNTNLTCETTYHYRVRAYRSSDNSYSGYSNVANATTAACSLTAPSNLTATPASPTQINLGWTDQSNNETSFRLERSPDGTNWQEIASVGANVTSYQNTSLTCETTYHYRVRAYRSNSNGYSGYSNVAQATTATCTVNAPSNLTATPASQTQIDLGWVDNTTLETAYRIERSPDGTNWQEIASVNANVTSYQNTSLTCETTYHYRVRAYRSSTNSYSEYSNVAQAMTLACPLTAPSSLIATPVSQTQINLGWTDNTTLETAYKIERSPDGTNWQEIASVNANVTSYQNTNLTCETTYHYRVRAYRSNDDTYSGYSNVAQATTATCTVNAPSNLTATPASQTQIDLGWVDNTTLETAYKIERSPDGTNWQEIASVGANVTSYQNTNLTCETTYHYRVRAYRSNSNSYSGYSNVAQATTLACSSTLTQVAPSGNVTSRTPVFRWSHVAGAQWYHVVVTTLSNSAVLDQWVQVGNGISCTSQCGFWPSTPLGNAVGTSTLQWKVQYYGATGTSSFYGPLAFTITPPTLQEPNGSIGQGYPTFRWTHNADATLYQVYVGGPNGAIIEWVNASQKCSGATCSTTLGTSLNGVGAYQWFVQGYSADGFGAWGGPGVFTLSGSPPPMINKTSPGAGASLTTSNIPFVWQANASATSYELFLSGPNGWSDYRSWDAATNCNASTCSISISVPSVGNYTWYLRGKNAAGFGPWGPNDAGGNLGARSFTVQIGVPGSVVPQSPVNTTVNTGQVAFSWQAVANATAYEFYVAGPNGWVNFQTWQAATTCTPGCTVNLMLPSNGGYTWYLRANGPGGSGAWSSGAAFSVSTTLPGAVTKQSPAQGGTVTTLVVTLTWAKVANANAYEVFLSGPGGFVHFQLHTPGQSATCGASSCSTTIYVPSQGSYQWYMRAWNPAGYGLWGPNQGSGDFDLRTFTVNPTAPAANPVLIAPANGSSVTAGGVVRFEWSAVNNATWYLVVLVNRNTGTIVSQTWVSGANAGCATGGTCSTNIAAAAGAYRWAVLTWGPGSTSVPTYQAGVTPTFTFDKVAS